MTVFSKFRQQGYPRRFTSTFLLLATLTLGTGLLLIPLLMTFKLGMNVDWYPSGGLRIWTTALHVLSGFAVLFLTGAIWSIHARAGWLRKMRHISGILLIGGIVSMTLTAPIMLYASSESTGATAAVTHTVIGLGLPLLLTAHAWRRHT